MCSWCKPSAGATKPEYQKRAHLQDFPMPESITAGHSHVTQLAASPVTPLPTAAGLPPPLRLPLRPAPTVSRHQAQAPVWHPRGRHRNRRRGRRIVDVAHSESSHNRQCLCRRGLSASHPAVRRAGCRFLRRAIPTPSKRVSVLVVLDDADAQLALAQARAELGQVQRKVRGYFASDVALGGQVDSRDGGHRRRDRESRERQGRLRSARV